MNDDDEETQLRRAFDALRRHDAASTPAFAPMRSRAEQAAARRMRRYTALTALALAAAVLLAIWWGGRPRELGPSVSFEQTEPLAFLLEPPSASVLSSAEGWR